MLYTSTVQFGEYIYIALKYIQPYSLITAVALLSKRLNFIFRLSVEERVENILN